MPVTDILGAPTTSNHPVDVGQRSEAAVLALLVKHGYRVLIPFGVNHRYDFALDTGDHFVRVQCKTGRLRDGAIIFNAQSTRSNTRKAYRRCYRGEIDLFAVFCPDTERVYAVPVEDAPTTTCYLRLHPTANSQAEGIRWAADYEMPA